MGCCCCVKKSNYTELNGECSPESQRRLIIAAVIVSVLALLTFLVKSALLLTQYGVIVNVDICEPFPEESNDTFESGSANMETITTSSNMDEAEEKNLDDTYAFTVAIATLVNVLRIGEYILLSYGLIKFARSYSKAKTKFRDNIKAAPKKICRRILLWCLLLTPYILLGTVAIPALGIVQEINHSKKCNKADHISIVFFAYCGVNVLRYTWDIVVRIGMITTTVVVRELWSENGAEENQGSHESNTNDTVENNITDPPTETPETPEISPAQNPDENHTMSHTCTCPKCSKYIHDMYQAETHVEKLEKEYKEKGKLVEECNELFQTWFILPWIIYFLVASLEAGNILHPWQDDNETFTSDYPKIYWYLYNINQLMTLLVPYLCAKQMERSHKKYFIDMQEQASNLKVKFGSTMTIPPIENYSFTPRVIFTGIRIEISNPLYFLFLAGGFFFTVSKTLH